MNGLAEYLNGSICVGCGCTDRFACEGGCGWLARDGEGLGVCSSCRNALPAWNKGARLAGWLQEGPQPFRIWLGDQRVPAYRPGTNQPRGAYFVEDWERATVRLVNERGLPYVGDREQLRVDYTVDWAEVARAKALSLPRRRSDAADAKRGHQLKAERVRARAKAAKKARQTQRRRS